MSENVDVLAVLSRIEDQVSCTDCWDVIPDLLNVRAAMVELIGALTHTKRTARIAHDDQQQEVICVSPEDWRRVCDALARVQGGA